MTATTLYHIAQQADYCRANDNQISGSSHYRCESLLREKFIHCCTAEQLAGVVSRYYQDATNLVLLTLDSARLDAEPVWENTVGGSELFPHIYGAIPLRAITHSESLDPAAVPAVSERE